MLRGFVQRGFYPPCSRPTVNSDVASSRGSRKELGRALTVAPAGKSYVVQAGPELKVLAVNDLDDGNHASPALAGGRMFLVGMKNLYCIGKRP